MVARLVVAGSLVSALTIRYLWPHSVAAMRDAFSGCSLDEVTMMTSETAADVYGFDLAQLAVVAERVGPGRRRHIRASH